MQVEQGGLHILDLSKQQDNLRKHLGVVRAQEGGDGAMALLEEIDVDARPKEHLAQFLLALGRMCQGLEQSVDREALLFPRALHLAGVGLGSHDLERGQGVGIHEHGVGKSEHADAGDLEGKGGIDNLAADGKERVGLPALNFVQDSTRTTNLEQKESVRLIDKALNRPP